MELLGWWINSSELTFRSSYLELRYCTWAPSTQHVVHCQALAELKTKLDFALSRLNDQERGQSR